jgi:hypothetical protein
MENSILRLVWVVRTRSGVLKGIDSVQAAEKKDVPLLLDVRNRFIHGDYKRAMSVEDWLFVLGPAEDAHLRKGQIAEATRILVRLFLAVHHELKEATASK